MPEASVQQVKYFELRKSQLKTPSLTFLCAYDGQETLLEDSINSITSIAEESGLEYEIFILNTTMIPINSVSTQGVNTDQSLKIADYGYLSRGEAKNEALKLCKGSHIIIFDPSKEYSLGYADLLYKFVNQREKVVLYSEFLIIRKDVIDHVKGWKNLKVSEDIDLLARISKIYSLVFYITEGYNSISRFLTYKPSQILTKKKMRWYTNKKKIDLMQDIIVGVNFKAKDIRFFWNGSSKFLGYIAYLKSKFKKYDESRDGNNFLIVLESLFESFILNEYDAFIVDNKEMKLSFEEEDLKYIAKYSEIYKKSDTIKKIIEVET